MGLIIYTARGSRYKLAAAGMGAHARDALFCNMGAHARDALFCNSQCTAVYMHVIDLRSCLSSQSPTLQSLHFCTEWFRR